MPKSSKGGAFERHVADRLSYWWTGDPNQSVFWRTSQSGGRATVRRRKGKFTAGHCGDIASTDPCSAPFTRLFAVEVKRGYKGVTFADLLDMPSSRVGKEFAGWVLQAEHAWSNSNSWSWLLITRRDVSIPLVIMPRDSFDDLGRYGAFVGNQPIPFVILRSEMVDLVALHFEQFLAQLNVQELIAFEQRIADAS